MRHHVALLAQKQQSLLKECKISCRVLESCVCSVTVPFIILHNSSVPLHFSIVIIIIRNRLVLRKKLPLLFSFGNDRALSRSLFFPAGDLWTMIHLNFWMHVKIIPDTWAVLMGNIEQQLYWFSAFLTFVLVVNRKDRLSKVFLHLIFLVWSGLVSAVTKLSVQTWCRPNNLRKKRKRILLCIQTD